VREQTFNLVPQRMIVFTRICNQRGPLFRAAIERGIAELVD
jgi:hypothetical protein